MITYNKSYYWLIRFRYFVYTVSPSPWTYPSSGRYSLAIVAINAFAAYILRLDMQNPREVFPATCCMWLIRLAALSWRNRPDFAFALLSTRSFAPIVKWSTRPHGLFTLAAALHAWERTCHFEHCSYSISQEICTRFCCALLCCGYAIVHNEFTLSIYPHSSGLLCWHWVNR